MNTTSSPNDLSARLRRRLETEHRQIEETTASELRRLGERSRAIVNDALHSIEADTATAAGRMRRTLLNAWLRPLVIGLGLFLGISGGSWALTHWLAARIQSRIETLAMLDVQTEQARETLAGIEDTTWGVRLLEIDGERVVVLPLGTLDDPRWTVGGLPALKLSSE